MGWTTPITAVTGVVATAADWNGSVRDPLLYLKGDAAWTAPTLLNGWVNYGAGFDTAGYRMEGDFVVLRGTVKSGTVSTAIFQLPVAYRPALSCNFAVVNNALFGGVGVDAATGNVNQLAFAGVNNTYVTLTGIRFEHV